MQNTNEGANAVQAGESSQTMVRDIPFLVRGILNLEASDIEFLGQKGDPTDEVLKWWETKNSATLRRFREVLGEMQREDIVQILDGYQSGSRNPRKTSRDNDIGPPSKQQKR